MQKLVHGLKMSGKNKKFYLCSKIKKTRDYVTAGLRDRENTRGPEVS